MADGKITRRDVVPRGAGAALGGLAAAQAAARPDTTEIVNYTPRMGCRRFGKTGVLLTEAERDEVTRLAAASLDMLPPDYAWIRDHLTV